MALFHIRDVLIPLLAILMAGTLLLWLERQPRRNLFLVRRDDPSVYEIETDFGRFIIDRKNRCLRVRSSSRIDEIPLELFERFDIAFRTEDLAHGLSREPRPRDGRMEIRKPGRVVPGIPDRMR